MKRIKKNMRFTRTHLCAKDAKRRQDYIELEPLYFRVLWPPCPQEFLLYHPALLLTTVVLNNYQIGTELSKLIEPVVEDGGGYDNQVRGRGVRVELVKLIQAFLIIRVLCEELIQDIPGHFSDALVVVIGHFSFYRNTKYSPLAVKDVFVYDTSNITKQLFLEVT